MLNEHVMAHAAHESLFVLDSEFLVVALNENAKHMLPEILGVGDSLTQAIGSSELEAMLRYVIENEESEFEVQTTIGERFYRVRIQRHVVDAEVSDTHKQIKLGVAFQDVTELVRLNRARRDMVANISHELRTPIANIRLIIDSLFYEGDKPKRKKSIQSVRDIARETDSLQWIVHELMDLSMIESGQAIVRMVDVPVDELVEEVVERMAEQAMNREVALIVKVSDDLHALCDKDLSRRVLINLLHNALKFAPKGSSITISAVNAGEYVMFTVYDRGAGVPQEQVERIFERFYQVDSSRSRHEGTGLGLSICKHIVDAHGGKIWAEGTETALGGKFMFTLLNPAHMDSK